MFKGNSEKVMADAARIVQRLRNTDITQGTLMKEYRCAYSTIMIAV